MRVGVCPGVRPEGPTPSVMLSAGGMCSTLFLLQVFRRGGWVFGLFVSRSPEFAPAAQVCGYL